jgi:prefoldin subunit 5
VKRSDVLATHNARTSELGQEVVMNAMNYEPDAKILKSQTALLSNRGATRSHVLTIHNVKTDEPGEETLMSVSATLFSYTATN